VERGRREVERGRWREGGGEREAERGRWREGGGEREAAKPSRRPDGRPRGGASPETHREGGELTFRRGYGNRLLIGSIHTMTSSPVL